MYVVNDHFIKPVTAMYGGMSFALMLHPDGLECDVFATHAWMEGGFEFYPCLLTCPLHGRETPPFPISIIPRHVCRCKPHGLVRIDSHTP